MTTVERLHEDDWERMRDARLTALRSDPDAFGSSLAREEGFKEAHWRMRLRGSPWFAAVDDDGGVVGIASGLAEPGAPPEERHLIGMWVRPDRRGSGVATLLADAVAAWARADGATTLTLWVVEGNAAAEAAYRRAGFATTGVTMALPRDPSRTEHQWARDVSTPGE